VTPKKPRALITATILVLSLIIAGCGGGNSPGESHAFPMAPLTELPSELRDAPLTVREAYQFAVANPDVLKAIPCYCGCGGMGHTSNYACYVSGEAADGSLNFDSHALGCSICVDITQDAMRMLNQGEPPEAIRAYIDQTYSRFGPSNMP